jgi:hypothetical protein
VNRIRRLLHALKPARRTALLLVTLAGAVTACSVEPETPRPRQPSRLMTDGGGELTHAIMDMAARPVPWKPGPM